MKRSLRIVVTLAFAVNVAAAVILVGGGLLATPSDAAPAAKPSPTAPVDPPLPSVPGAQPAAAVPAAEPPPATAGAAAPSAALDPALAASTASDVAATAAAPTVASLPETGAAASGGKALPGTIATDDAFARLKRAYENMEPETAAKAVRELAARDRGAVVALLLAFNARTAGAILDGLTTSDPALAADLSYEIWKRSGKASPSAAVGNSREPIPSAKSAAQSAPAGGTAQ